MKTLREMNRRGVKGSEPLNALNALNAHPRPERPVAEAAVIDECENADSLEEAQRSFQTSTCAKSAISAKSPSPIRANSKLWSGGAPRLIDPERWQQTVEDGRQFLATWGEQAKDLGWTAQELFGLHQVPAKPHPSFQRLRPLQLDRAGLASARPRRGQDDGSLCRHPNRVRRHRGVSQEQ